MIDSAERELVVRTWNATSVDYPHTQCIHEVFASRVRAHPAFPNRDPG